MANSSKVSALDTLTDEQLMTLLQTAGNQAAFEVIVRRHTYTVTGSVHNRLPPDLRGDTDDLVQEVFLKLYALKDRFIRDSFVSSYLLVTTHRTVVNHLKSLRRMRRDHQRTVYTADAVCDNRAEQKALATVAIQHFLAQLTPAEAEIVRVMDLEGRTAHEAAVALKIPKTTAEWRHRKAMAHLRNLAAEEVAA